MKLHAALLGLCLLPGIAAAQNWRLGTFDDGSFFMGAIYQSPGFALSCGERSPLGKSAMETGNMEPTITRPGLLRMSLSDEELGFPEGVVRPRDDVMIVVGTLGYTLPEVRFDELINEWWTDLPLGDPLFAAIAAVEHVEIRSRDGVSQVDARGFAGGINALSAYCQRMFAAIGQPWQVTPAVNAAAPQVAGGMRGAAEAGILSVCGGPAAREPGYLLAGDIDGDGLEDVVVDWRALQCQVGMPRPLCGASMCSANAYLSSRYPVAGRPEEMLALGVSLVPLSNGNMGVRVGLSLSECGGTACDSVFYWTGSDLVALP